jgi:hypothetical protein
LRPPILDRRHRSRQDLPGSNGGGGRRMPLVLMSLLCCGPGNLRRQRPSILFRGRGGSSACSRIPIGTPSLPGACGTWKGAKLRHSPTLSIVRPFASTGIARPILVPWHKRQHVGARATRIPRPRAPGTWGGAGGGGRPGGRTSRTATGSSPRRLPPLPPHHHHHHLGRPPPFPSAPRQTCCQGARQALLALLGYTCLA